jgi:hypothetical protein
MKKSTLYIITALLLLSFSPLQMQASMITSRPATDSTRTVESTAANALITRLDEINTMDKSHLSASEKRHLRKEVRSINNHLTYGTGGVYLSVGAIIIIVLLLILLL